MKVVHVSHADVAGGAARATWRLHQALRERDVDSFMAVNDASVGDWTVDGPTSARAKVAARLRPHVGAQVTRLQRSDNRVLHSTALLPGGLEQRLEARGAQIAHLHWINGEMCSIAELGRLDIPVVWTMHDMWPFCGSEHYTNDNRWKEGYRRDNRAPGHKGIDLDRWTWKRKRVHWRKPFQLVAPSQWLAECARQSALMQDWPVTVIPNALDTKLWHPRDRAVARDLFGLPQDRKLVLFGAVGGTQDLRKGSDLLVGALSRLASEYTKLELVIFGQTRPQHPESWGFPVHYCGTLRDEATLAMLYSAADVFVLPSRQDNLPNTGVEAQASGLPVVAFDTGGLSDIVRHRETGYLAQPFEVDDLARGISWVIEDETRWTSLCANAAIHAENEYAAPVVAARYIALYETLIRGETV